MTAISFTEHKAALSGGALTYLKGGSGRPIVHLHSSGGPRVSPAIETWARRHTVLMPTVPGFDGTPFHDTATSMPTLAGVMAEFVRSVAGEQCDVIGESLGGWVALWLAVRHPDLVDHLVLEAPAGLRTEGTGGMPPDPAIRHRMLYAVPERAPQETRSQQAVAANGKARERYAGRVTLDRELLAALPQIKARTLVVMGTKDEVVPLDTARRIVDAVPHTHLSYVYGAAHAVEFDQPQRLARLVGGFLERGEAFLVPRNEVPASA
jgi:pimeloyl-ACP methyl ester carboxylesterase